MGDAEIIPIGTRGRPGRGTGKAPSSAARSLATGVKPPPANGRKPPAKPEAARPTREAMAERPADGPVIQTKAEPGYWRSASWQG